MEKDEYYEEKQIGLTTYYRLHPAFDWHEMSNKDLTKKINELQAELKRVLAKTSNENAVLPIHGVMQRSELLLFADYYENDKTSQTTDEVVDNYLAEKSNSA